MPQSREHLAILDLLQIEHGVIALTKSDLVESDWLDLVESDVCELVAGTSLAEAPIVACSAISRAGLDQLTQLIDSSLEELPAVRDIGRPRLPIDRVFTISGFGTVVTGTLIDGQLAVGEQAVVEPGTQIARLRGLQSHKRQVEVAQPGTRTAVNLSGVSPEDLHRGQVVTTPGWLQATVSMDVRLRAVADAPRTLRHGATLTLHTGASEVAARVRLLEGNALDPGNETWAQLRLEAPVAAARGDFFVLRSSEDTVAGGRIVDTRPRRHRRNERGTLDALQRLLEGSPDDALLTVLQRLEPVALADLRTRAEMDETAFNEVLTRQIADGGVIVLDQAGSANSAPKEASSLTTAAGFEALAAKALALINEFVTEHPLRPGIPKEELRSRLVLTGRAFQGFEALLSTGGRLVARERTLDLPSRSVELSAEQIAAVEALMQGLRKGRTRPEATDRIDPELAAHLESRGQIVRVGDGIMLEVGVHTEMVDEVTTHLREHGTITLAEARDLLGTSRKIAQAFLENLDQRQITRRVGDARVLRGS